MVRLLQTVYKERWAYIFLFFPLTVLFVFRILPMIWTVVISFSHYHPDGLSWVGFKNYLDMFGHDLFWKALKNTAIYTIGVVPLGLIISLGLAQLIVQLRSKAAQNFFKSAFYLPAVASGAILSLVWLWLFEPSRGLLNYLLSLIGLGPFMWLGDPNIALFSIIFMTLAGGGGAAVVLLTASMGNIPDTLYESSRIDGSNRLQEFIWITVPLLKPTILYLLVVSTIASFQVFTQIYIMTSGGPYYSTLTSVYLMYSYAFEVMDFGKATAQGMILFIIVAALAVIQYRSLSADIEY